MLRYHDRMPVILEPKDFDGWLNRSLGIEVLLPAAESMLRSSGEWTRPDLNRSCWIRLTIKAQTPEENQSWTRFFTVRLPSQGDYRTQSMINWRRRRSGPAPALVDNEPGDRVEHRLRFVGPDRMTALFEDP
jgi:hypothetical protein